jgi:cytochrome c-type biogenesis protein CcmH/NrfG
MIFTFIALALMALATGLWLAQPILPAHRRLALIIMASVLSTSAALYALYGNVNVLKALKLKQEAEAQLPALQAAVAAAPKEIEGWLSLAEAHRQAGHFAHASEALRQSVLLSEGNPTVLALYGESLVQQAGGEVTEEARKAFDMALLQHPEQPQSLYFVGLYEAQHGNFTQALATWRSAHDQLSSDHPLAKRLARNIAGVEKRLEEAN